VRKNKRDFRVGDIVEFRDLYLEGMETVRERGIVVRLSDSGEMWIHWLNGEFSGRIEHFRHTSSVYWVIVLVCGVESDEEKRERILNALKA